MEKQVIYAISNREDYICYEVGKSRSYYNFLLNLLKEFKVSQLPDLYDEESKLPNPMEERDSTFHWEDKHISVIQVIGYKKIFLFVRTKHRKKLAKFIEENCEFIKPKINRLA